MAHFRKEGSFKGCFPLAAAAMLMRKQGSLHQLAAAKLSLPVSHLSSQVPRPPKSASWKGVTKEERDKKDVFMG